MRNETWYAKSGVWKRIGQSDISPPAPPVPKPLLGGATSGDTSSSFSSFESQVGALRIRRSYAGSGVFPSTYAASNAGIDAGVRESLWSFKPTPATFAAGGNDTWFNSFLSSIPNGQKVIFILWHFPEDPNIHAQLRVRRRDERYEITKKLPVEAGDASAHVEHTIPLTEAEYTSLRDASSRKIYKERYKTTIDGYSAEIDIFRGLLSGLVLVDFEFGSEAERVAFEPPECCLTEVTQQEFLAGGVLSSTSYTDISRKLARLGYIPLEYGEG